MKYEQRIDKKRISWYHIIDGFYHFCYIYLEEKEMKKFLSIISVCIVIIMLTSVLSSCGPKSPFVGTWDEVDPSTGMRVPDGEILILADDGTGSLVSGGVNGSLNWTHRNDKLTITASMCGVSVTHEYSFQFVGDTMFLVDEEGEETIYRRR
jgi:hypothetical protein